MGLKKKCFCCNDYEPVYKVRSTKRKNTKVIDPRVPSVSLVRLEDDSKLESYIIENNIHTGFKNFGRSNSAEKGVDENDIEKLIKENNSSDHSDLKIKEVSTISNLSFDFISSNESAQFSTEKCDSKTSEFLVGFRNHTSKSNVVNQKGNNVGSESQSSDTSETSTLKNKVEEMLTDNNDGAVILSHDIKFSDAKKIRPCPASRRKVRINQKGKNVGSESQSSDISETYTLENKVEEMLTDNNDSSGILSHDVKFSNVEKVRPCRASSRKSKINWKEENVGSLSQSSGISDPPTSEVKVEITDNSACTVLCDVKISDAQKIKPCPASQKKIKIIGKVNDESESLSIEMLDTSVSEERKEEEMETDINNSASKELPNVKISDGQKMKPCPVSQKKDRIIQIKGIGDQLQSDNVFDENDTVLKNGSILNNDSLNSCSKKKISPDIEEPLSLISKLTGCQIPPSKVKVLPLTSNCVSSLKDNNDYNDCNFELSKNTSEFPGKNKNMSDNLTHNGASLHSSGSVAEKQKCSDGKNLFHHAPERIECNEGVRTVYDVMEYISIIMPSWNLHILPDTNTFCICKVTRNKHGVPNISKCIELDDDFNGKVYIYKQHFKQFDGVYNSEDAVVALIREVDEIF